MSKKLLIINSVAGIKSTGRIAVSIAQEYKTKGYECRIAYGRYDAPSDINDISIKIGNRIDFISHVIQTRFFDRHGLGSVLATKKFLRWATQYNPDELWLHNIHGYYLNYELLFMWIKKRQNMHVKWTLHDCWPFTGHCIHFEDISCSKWISGCDNCPKKLEYPQSFIFDNSHINYNKKRKAFSNVNNLVIYTPSVWLKKLVQKSFLREYKVEIHHNNIDLKEFQQVHSDFRIKHGLANKIIILGVASSWNRSKGLYDFIHLRELIDDNYAIVLVGLTKSQMKTIPNGILGLSLTHSKRELAEIYSAADIFFNPTYSDTYPTVNLEAQACGTPVITYDTGGSPESVPTENVVAIGDLESAIKLIKKRNLKIYHQFN